MNVRAVPVQTIVRTHGQINSRNAPKAVSEELLALGVLI
jgi:hypothetical protein